MKLSIDHATEELIDELRKHQAARPAQDPDDDCFVHIDHLRVRQDRWQAHDTALRTVIGERLTRIALEEE